jgi:hypothetical protein
MSTDYLIRGNFPGLTDWGGGSCTQEENREEKLKIPTYMVEDTPLAILKLMY